MGLSTYFLVFFVVELILYVFHLSMLVLMVAKRNVNFKGPFFNIFRIVLAADFLCYAITTFCQKSELISFIINYLMSHSYTASGIFAVLNFLTVMQFIGHLFLALNRFTLIRFPLKHEHIWKRQWYTVIIFIIPLINASWRLHEPADITFTADNVFVINYRNKAVGNLNNILSLMIFFSTTCFAAVFNFLSFVKFFIRKQNNVSLNVNEKNLLFVSFIIFISQLLRVTYSANKLLFPANMELISFFNIILPILNGLFAWSGSISLMVLSSLTRKAYKSFYFCSPHINYNNSPMPKLFPAANM